MASNGKKKTTFAKLNRENAVRERRLIKQAKKTARRQAATAAPAPALEQPDAPEVERAVPLDSPAAPPS